MATKQERKAQVAGNKLRKLRDWALMLADSSFAINEEFGRTMLAVIDDTPLPQTTALADLMKLLNDKDATIIAAKGVAAHNIGEASKGWARVRELEAQLEGKPLPEHLVQIKALSAMATAQEADRASMYAAGVEQALRIVQLEQDVEGWEKWAHEIHGGYGDDDEICLRCGGDYYSCCQYQDDEDDYCPACDYLWSECACSDGQELDPDYSDADPDGLAAMADRDECDELCEESEPGL